MKGADVVKYYKIYCEIGMMKVQMRITHDNKVSKGAEVVKHYTRCCQIGIIKVQRGMRHVSEVLKALL